MVHISERIKSMTLSIVWDRKKAMAYLNERWEKAKSVISIVAIRTNNILRAKCFKKDKKFQTC